MHDSLSFTQGFLLGQISICAIIFFFIKFFIFGEAPRSTAPSSYYATSGNATTRLLSTPARSAARTRSFSGRPRPAVPKPSNPLRPISSQALSTPSILNKTFYNVNAHPPESLDWFNVLLAQTITQLRTDAQADPAAVLGALNAVLNSDRKPGWLADIQVTDISLGEEFPIFGNCRIIPVEDEAAPWEASGAGFGGLAENPSFQGAPRPRSASGLPPGPTTEPRLQARMDVDISDNVTLGIETKLVINFPRPYSAVIPVALSVSLIRFSGTLSVSFIPSPLPKATPAGGAFGMESPFDDGDEEPRQEDAQTQPTPPTTLTFSFAPDYRLELSTHSLLGSRSRLQDVPKIAQLIDSRLHAWFDERCVAPRFQQVELPSFWPRMQRTRGRDTDATNEGTGTRPKSRGLEIEGLAGADRSFAGLGFTTATPNLGRVEQHKDLTTAQIVDGFSVEQTLNMRRRRADMDVAEGRDPNRRMPGSLPP